MKTKVNIILNRSEGTNPDAPSQIKFILDIIKPLLQDITIEEIKITRGTE